MKLRRKIIFSLIPVLLLYAVAEAVTTALFLRGDLQPISIWVLEDTGAGSTIQFDPVLGYRLTRTPARMACIATNGVVESVGTVRGNNQGFPDRDDFEAQRTDPDVTRIAVFGDSFSAAQFLTMNWPDRCEDLAREAGQSVELLNLSIDGGGHTNWRETLCEFIDARDYQLDGIIFAVYGNDLRRPFVIWDDQVVQTAPDGTRTIGFGTVWNHALPKTLDEARPFFHGLPRWQVHSTENLDRMLSGTLRPSEPRSGLFLTGQIFRAIFVPTRDPQQYTMDDVAAYHEHVDPQRLQLWNDIRNSLFAREIPALVIDVPGLDFLLQGSGPSADAQTFAQFLKATFVDGADAFGGLTPDEIRADWMPYDPHWGQPGSDRFAGFVASILSDWPPRKESDAKSQSGNE